MRNLTSRYRSQDLDIRKNSTWVQSPEFRMLNLTEDCRVLNFKFKKISVKSCLLVLNLRPSEHEPEALTTILWRFDERGNQKGSSCYAEIGNFLVEIRWFGHDSNPSVSGPLLHLTLQGRTLLSSLDFHIQKSKFWTQVEFFLVIF